MVALTTGPFAHFDLADGAQCITLAYAIEHYLSANASTPHNGIRNASSFQLATADALAQRIGGSPLMTGIITPFLRAPRYIFNRPEELLARARDMEAYINKDIYYPGSPEYAVAENAWRNHIRSQPFHAATGARGFNVGGAHTLSRRQPINFRGDTSTGYEIGAVDMRTWPNTDGDKVEARTNREQIEKEAALAVSRRAGHHNTQSSIEPSSESNIEVSRKFTRDHVENCLLNQSKRDRCRRVPVGSIVLEGLEDIE